MISMCYIYNLRPYKAGATGSSPVLPTKEIKTTRTAGGFFVMYTHG